MESNNQQLKDLVIVGGGPAGLTASIYAQRSLLDAVTLEQEAFGGQTILTSEIDNYPGLPHTDGYTLSEAMRSQATDLGAEVRMEQVTGISRDDKSGLFTLVTPDGDLVAKSVILAGGATPRRLPGRGEVRLSWSFVLRYLRWHVLPRKARLRCGRWKLCGRGGLVPHALCKRGHLDRA